MPTRLCARCAQQKSIRGVWYILPQVGAPAAFVCETCFARAARESITLAAHATS